MNAQEQYDHYHQQYRDVTERMIALGANNTSDYRHQLSRQILSDLLLKIQAYGEKTFPLSEKQVAIIEQWLSEQREYNRVIADAAIELAPATKANRAAEEAVNAAPTIGDTLDEQLLSKAIALAGGEGAGKALAAAIRSGEWLAPANFTSQERWLIFAKLDAWYSERYLA